MYALLYTSRARTSLLADDLNQIIEVAQAHNRSLDVTGLLLHGRMEAIPSVPGGFVQWIEGPQDAVEALFADIEDDPRHTDVEVIAQGEIADLEREAHGVPKRTSYDGRLFPAWSMGLVQLAELPATLDGFLRFAADWTRDGFSEAA